MRPRGSRTRATVFPPRFSPWNRGNRGSPDAPPAPALAQRESGLWTFFDEAREIGDALRAQRQGLEGRCADGLNDADGEGGQGGGEQEK